MTSPTPVSPDNPTDTSKDDSPLDRGEPASTDARVGREDPPGEPDDGGDDDYVPL